MKVWLISFTIFAIHEKSVIQVNRSFLIIANNYWRIRSKIIRAKSLIWINAKKCSSNLFQVRGLNQLIIFRLCDEFKNLDLVKLFCYYVLISIGVYIVYNHLSLSIHIPQSHLIFITNFLFLLAFTLCWKILDFLS